MHIFEFFIEDDRRTVPSLELVQAPGAARARELASERLFASSHHLSVEVRVDSERLFLVSRSTSTLDTGDAHDSAAQG